MQHRKQLWTKIILRCTFTFKCLNTPCWLAIVDGSLFFSRVTMYRDDAVWWCKLNVVDGRRLTFSELMTLSCQLARGLTLSGFKPRDRLLMICQNVVECAPLLFAVARCRGQLTTLSPASTDGQPILSVSLLFTAHSGSTGNTRPKNDGTKMNIGKLYCCGSTENFFSY